MIFLFKCVLCGNKVKKYFLERKDVPPSLTCECSGIMERQVPDFDFVSLETVDTGSMARKVELRKDATKRFKERGDIHIKNMKDRERIAKK